MKGIDVSRSTILKWVRNRTFPAPLDLGGFKVIYTRADVDRWLEELPNTNKRTSKGKHLVRNETTAKRKKKSTKGWKTRRKRYGKSGLNTDVIERRRRESSGK